MTNHRKQLLAMADRARADAEVLSDPALRLLLLQMAATCREWAQHQALTFPSDLGPHDSHGDREERPEGGMQRS